MTDNDKEPELTPAEQHKQDLARVQAQLGITDITRAVTSVFGGNGAFARTDFEGHALNAMIDMVQSANPADLENAGDNLWLARKALSDAAEELRTNVGKVHWEGQSGEAFRDFGKALADHADKLSTFADVAATQIRVAGTGLASVRNSMPERDNRLVKHDAKTMPVPERVDTNPDYVAAKKAEQNRQEAINQMNRLASFYAVSEQALAGQEAPKFDRVLKADVPRPSGEVVIGDSPAENRKGGLSGTPATPSVSERREGPRSYGEPPRAEVGGTPQTTPGRDPSMQIDSVAPPVAPPTNPNSAPPPIIAPGPGGGPPVVQTPPMGPPVVATPPNTFKPGPGGSPPPFVSKSAGGPGQGGQNHVTSRATPGQPYGPGRQPVIGGAPPSSTGAQNPVGRPTGPMGPGGQPSPMGRANPMATGPAAGGQGPITGRGGQSAQPMAGRPNTPSAGSRAGRDGIVGGTPQRATGGTNAPRIPRGTIVGADGPVNARSAARPQPGVIGGGAQSVNGVVGAPRSGSNAGSRGSRGNFTTGGAGLVGGRPGRTPSDREEERSESTRPDYLTEDEETWTAQRRNAGPPVID
ncbi:hypothetical protein AB0G74_07055 [Streptomyces sp. NPDC020875]|uniref:hypothetical protein n=1 Tax=Streptomyces sp. NPDC020875 TaxID=3154898 RepID=UPI00340B4780